MACRIDPSLTKIICAGLLAIWLGLLAPNGTAASGSRLDPPPGPDRFILVDEDYTAYTWWLVEWGTDNADCVIQIDHEGQPTNAEVYDQCGATVYTAWKTTPACQKEDPRQCSGYYLFLYDVTATTRRVSKPLPAAKIWLSAPHCFSDGVGLLCPEHPMLTLLGDEPLDGYAITRIAGMLDEQVFACDADQCDLHLPTADGTYSLQFGGYSSYGDSTRTQEARLQVTGGEDGWYISVLSDRWLGIPQAACAEVWDVFPPPADTLPRWLAQNLTPEDLHTERQFAFLSGQLLAHGLVNAPQCADGGFAEDGWATECGLAAAAPETLLWQNRFDEEIVAVGEQYQVPPLLLKAVFARENQMWPGAGAEHHAGFGQIMENGADMALMWNPRLFEQFCPQVYSPDTCANGYLRLSDAQRAFLRQALMARVDAECPSCENGVDLAKAVESISYFAEVLRASCAQTGRIVTNLTSRSAGAVFSYEDLWKLTIANYHVGAGCTRDALSAALKQSASLAWEQVAANYPAGCNGLEYVQDVIHGP